MDIDKWELWRSHLALRGRLALRATIALTIAWVTSSTLMALDSRPNILFILADDVGSEVLECYGGQSYQTPRLNQLAREGLRFDHAYTMPVCHPTRICFLTGQYPIHLGNPKWGTFPESTASRTIAQVLKKADYATAIAGKWQLTLLTDDPTHPNRLGFDEYCLFGWHEGPRYYQPHIRQNGKLREDVHNRYGPDVYCDFLIDFMTRDRNHPFFAYYSMALCHEVTDDLEEPVPVGANGRYQNFSEMVETMDQRVGRLLDAIDDAGLRENTLVLFFTDNGSPRTLVDRIEGGEMIAYPVSSLRNGVNLPGSKTLLTDAGTRVPLIARWPGKVAADSFSDQLVDVSDFLPTLAEIADATLPSGVTLDGQSFAQLLKGKSEPGRKWVFAEHKGSAFVKNRRWKLYDDGRLFDLANDPEEQRPLDEETQTEKLSTSRRKLQQGFESIRWQSSRP